MGVGGIPRYGVQPYSVPTVASIMEKLKLELGTSDQQAQSGNSEAGQKFNGGCSLKVASQK